MVGAYLRGLLKPQLSYGTRSLVSESVIFEALASEHMAQNMLDGISADLALIPVLTEKGVRSTIDNTNARLRRAAELRVFDLYKVVDQLSDQLKLANPQKELSLYQLYQIAEKQGIFEAFDEHYREEDATPLI